jgi:hypothetical protein
MRSRVHSSFVLLSAACALTVLVAGCDKNHHDATGPTTGVIVGTVSSSLGGALDSVSLVVTPASGQAMTAVRSTSTGTFRIPDVSISTGKGTIAVADVPFNCTAPAPVSYTGLAAGDSLAVPIVVTCVPPTGTISGTITSSLGGTIANASIVVTPTGGSALAAVTTSSVGLYSVTGVALGGGTVSVSSLPTNCTAPSPKAYTGVTFDSTLTVSLTITCTPLTGTISGTVSSSLGGGIASAKVTVTPAGLAALPAVQTSGTGVYSTTVPVGTGSGSVAVSQLPGNCTVPAAAPYSGLASQRTVTVNVTVTCAPLTGSMTVTLTVPNGVTPSVTVTGPGSYNQSVTATQTLTNLTPGTYTVAAATFRSTGGIVTVVDTGVVTGSPATVTAGATASVGVTYIPEGPSGLWLANRTGSDQYAQFVANQLTANGSPTPNAVVSGSASNRIGIAFDRSGNLWSVDVSANRLHEYTAAQLSNPAASPTATISAGDFVDIAGLAFDASGNLWIANYGPCQIDEYTAAQLAGATGTVTIAPSLVVDNCSAALSGPTGLAFDASGNLWVTDRDYSRIDEFTAASLAATGTINITPAVELRTTGIDGQYLAFDASGNLWESSGSTSLVEYSPSQLASGGTVTPTATITTTSASFEGVAFDNGGNLWVVDFVNKAVDEFSTSQLSGGTISPTVSITTSNGSANDAPWTLAFDLHSSSLPLYNRVRPLKAVRK